MVISRSWWACILLSAAVSSSPVIKAVLVLHSDSSSPPRSPLDPRKEHYSYGYGESPVSRTVFTVVSLFCMSLLAGMIGYRVRQVDRHQIRHLSLTHYLIFILYVCSTAFVLSAAIIESGLGLSSHTVCRGAIILCLAFYVGSKVIMYLFLVERAHALRAPYMNRLKDWLWVCGTVTIAVGFGAIAITGFVRPISSISAADGRCRIGLPRFVTIPLLSFDVAINVVLTLIFVYLLSPLVLSGSHSIRAFPASKLTKCLGGMCGRSWTRTTVDIRQGNAHVARRIEKLLWRTFVGSCLVLLPTVGNMASLTYLKGKELGYVCLTICTFDVTWTVGVFHWLTIGTSEAEEQASVVLLCLLTVTRSNRTYSERHTPGRRASVGPLHDVPLEMSPMGSHKSRDSPQDLFSISRQVTSELSSGTLGGRSVE